MRGDRLRQLRLQRGLTQEDLAAALHLGGKEIWRYENNKTDPSAETLAHIADFMRVSADYLLGLSNEPLPLSTSDLNPVEREVIAAWRHGNYAAAARKLLNDEEVPNGA